MSFPRLLYYKHRTNPDLQGFPAHLSIVGTDVGFMTLRTQSTLLAPINAEPRKVFL